MLQFGVGSILVLLAWVTRLIKMPKMNKDTVGSRILHDVIPSLPFVRWRCSVVGHSTIGSGAHTWKLLHEYQSWTGCGFVHAYHQG